jgi:Xaa-Pro aminopeptidase
LNGRVARLRDRLEQPLLVTTAKNVEYLVGLESSNAAVLVARDSVTLYTDFRYLEAARALGGVEVVQTRRALLADIAERLSGRIGFEAGSLAYRAYEVLGGGAIEPVATVGLVERLRAVKDESELALIRKACAVADRVFERLAELPFVGRTERDLSWDITRLFHEEGGDALAFESIVGAGPTGSRPHARARERTIGRGELVVVDAGCVVDGYASDCTRTFATGKIDGEAHEAYETVLAAQQAALDGFRAGLSGVEADRLAREVIDGSAFGQTMGHGLGHGIGLDVHELPRLSTESDDVLAAGNVVTVEPGIYVEGRFGIRIEDDVVVAETGIENLTGVRKDLVEVS